MHDVGNTGTLRPVKLLSPIPAPRWRVLDLARKNLDRRFAKLKPIDQWARPPKGWLRAIRDAVGMTAAQMAVRLGVSQPRIFALEKDEVRGAVTLETLSRAAQALDCTLVYALVPNQPLEERVQKQAQKVAAGRIASVDQTMRLENQGLSAKELQAERERLTAELLRGNLRRLWDILHERGPSLRGRRRSHSVDS